MSEPESESEHTQLERVELVEPDISDVIRNLPPEQMRQVDPMEVMKLRLAAEREERADQQVAERARMGHSSRMMVFLVVVGAIVLEFLVGVTVLVWADENWNELKDLLAYGVAPLAAALGFAASHFFPAGPQTG